MKRALITGITGQDGSYLAELLLSKDYEVHGLIRRASQFNTDRLAHIFQDPHEERVNLYLHYGDVLDPACLIRLIDKIHPDEVYNLAAQSHTLVGFDGPEVTCEVTTRGTLNLLQAIRSASSTIKFLQASSAEVFGRARETPQSETTPHAPVSPSGVAKSFSHWITASYRHAYGLFAANAILFNHESPRRGETFVTRKITRGIASVLSGQQARLYLGNLEAKRDWGYAKEYVEGMWRILQAPTPGEFVLATGESHTVREFVGECCSVVGVNPEEFVEIDKRYIRPIEVEHLIGDASRARRELGWSPTVRFRELARIMLAADLEAVGINPDRYGLSPSQDRAVIHGAVR